MRSSVEMTGMTELPSGMRATREKRKIAASKLLKKVRAPAKKKLPASAQACHTLQELHQSERGINDPYCTLAYKTVASQGLW